MNEVKAPAIMMGDFNFDLEYPNEYDNFDHKKYEDIWRSLNIEGDDFTMYTTP
jgi:hypothetical protein